jgi:predicted acyl esterase
LNETEFGTMWSTATRHGAGATAVDFEFDVEEALEVLGTPTARLDVQLLGDDATLFVKVYHDDGDGAELVHNQVTPVAVSGAGEWQTVEVETTALQRRLEPGEALRITVASTDAGFASSRKTRGVRLFHSDGSESAVTFPTK